MLGEKKIFLALILSDVVFILLINDKMPTTVGILTFMSKIDFMLSELSMKKFYNFWARNVLIKNNNKGPVSPITLRI